jgi:hypothetical protein
LLRNIVSPAHSMTRISTATALTAAAAVRRSLYISLLMSAYDHQPGTRLPVHTTGQTDCALGASTTDGEPTPMSSPRPISPSGSSSPACLTALPNEVLEHVFTLLTIPDRLRLNRVSGLRFASRLHLILTPILGMQALTRSVHRVRSVAVRLPPSDLWPSRRAVLASTRRSIWQHTLTLALALTIPYVPFSCALSPPELPRTTTCPGPRRLPLRVPLDTSRPAAGPALDTRESEITGRARAAVGDPGFRRDEKVHHQRTGGSLRASRRDVPHL